MLSLALTFVLCQVSLLLLPSVEDFEEHLLSAVSEDLASGVGVVYVM